MNQAVYKSELLNYPWGENKGIKVVPSHGAIQAVEREGEWYPRIRQLLHVGRGVWAEINACCDVPVEPWTRSQIERSHLERVYNMQIMRPSLGEILPGVSCGVAAS